MFKERWLCLVTFEMRCGEVWPNLRLDKIRLAKVLLILVKLG